jgi:hypothetical protein
MGSRFAKIAIMTAIVAVVGLPVTHTGYFLLLAATAVLLHAGSIRFERRNWLAAAAVAAIAVAGQYLTAPPTIEEGHNVFVYDSSKPKGVLEKELPADVFSFMAAQFDALYPADRRCAPNVGGCWRGDPFPQTLFAPSSDAIYDRPAYSRRVSAIDFDDPTWLRLGFTNDLRYNWYNHISDVQRGHRDPRAWRFWHRWILTMPWYVMYQFPAQFAGSDLCWRGDVLWEQADGRFAPERHATMACRELQPADAGRRIFGVSIHPESLAMQLKPPAGLRARQIAAPLLAFLASAMVLSLLVRCRPRDLRWPFFLLGIGAVVIVLSDASLFGGFRYHDGGDDGLVYEGRGRDIVQYLFQGDLWNALRGGVDVFYFTPGMRYLRAVERMLFGDSNFGYLALLLAMPAILWKLARLFLTERWSLALVLIFVLTPIGLLFGSNYFYYVQNASRGYADTAAAIILLGGILVLFKSGDEAPDAARFLRPLAAALLMAVAVQVRPNLALTVAVLLGVSGFAALFARDVVRLAGLCIGFVPVFLCALHNRVYGGVFVLFSSNANHDSVYKVSPSDYVHAAWELVHLDFKDAALSRIAGLLTGWLSGPREMLAMVPLHVFAFLLLLRVGSARKFSPRLRLLAWATAAGHSVAFVYVSTPRYYYVIWLLNLIVVAAWLQQGLMPCIDARFPAFAGAVRRNRLIGLAGRALGRTEVLIGLR